MALEEDLRTPLILNMVEIMLRVDFDDEIEKKLILAEYPDSYIEEVFGELDEYME